MIRGGDYNFSANPLGNNVSVGGVPVVVATGEYQADNEYKSRYEWLFWHGI